jgi:hypothetical protein
VAAGQPAAGQGGGCLIGECDRHQSLLDSQPPARPGGEQEPSLQQAARLGEQFGIGARRQAFPVGVPDPVTEQHLAVAQQPRRAADPGGTVLEPAPRQRQQLSQLPAHLIDNRLRRAARGYRPGSGVDPVQITRPARGRGLNAAPPHRDLGHRHADGQHQHGRLHVGTPCHGEPVIRHGEEEVEPQRRRDRRQHPGQPVPARRDRDDHQHQRQRGVGIRHAAPERDKDSSQRQRRGQPGQHRDPCLVHLPCHGPQTSSRHSVTAAPVVAARAGRKNKPVCVTWAMTPVIKTATASGAASPAAGAGVSATSRAGGTGAIASSSVAHVTGIGSAPSTAAIVISWAALHASSAVRRQGQLAGSAAAETGSSATGRTSATGVASAAGARDVRRGNESGSTISALQYESTRKNRADQTSRLT